MIKYLINQKFGKLTPIKRSHLKKRSSWICLCDCGKETNVITNKIISGHTKSCGCERGAPGRKKPKFFSENLKAKRLERKLKLGYINSPETRIKIGLAGIGRVTSKKTKEKQSLAHRGKKHYNWKGGITKLNLAIRRTLKYRLWRDEIFTRDNYTCQKCEVNKIYLEAHHIKSFSVILKENNIKTVEDSLLCNNLWNINNGITLCKKCHKKTENYKGKAKLLLKNKKPWQKK